jgi:hypothetical protein
MSDSLLSKLRRAAMEKVAMDPLAARTLLAGGAGAVAAGVPITLLMRAHEDAARKRAQNVGFGAGVATGLAGPHIIRGLHGALEGMNQ